MSDSWKTEEASKPDGRTSTSVDGGTMPLSEPSRPGSPSHGPSRAKEKANVRHTGNTSNTQSTPLTAHDAAVKDMDERLEAIRIAGVIPNPDSQASSSESGSPNPTSGLYIRPMENIVDAFSGQIIGLMGSQECDKSQNDLWEHLKEIKNLQCEIATMHATMEGLGGNERKPRRRETTGDDDAINVEEEAKAAKAAEFSKLADKFTGRKDAIDAVMGKLDTLSRTINEFHSTRMPSLQFDSPSQDQPSSSGPGHALNETSLTSSARRPLTDADVIQDSPESGARPL